MGIQSEMGRGENLLRFSDTVLQPDKAKRGTSGKPRAAAPESGGPGSLAAGMKVVEDKGRGLTSSLKSGLALGTTIHPFDGGDPQTVASASGTSIFDPVLCELFYRWFVPKGGHILDPFAGGSVRGIVASRLGYQYTGIDLRQEQVDANEHQAQKVCTAPYPQWHQGDSVEYRLPDESVDAFWSCPPYFNLEQYSDDPLDLSNMTYDDFLSSYYGIIQNAADALKPDRFAGWVIGEVRDKDGFCRGLVPDTISIFEKCGLRLYNDAILLMAVGSLSIRIGRQFRGSRKLGRTHQHVLIFIKGNPKKAAEAVGND